MDTNPTNRLTPGKKLLLLLVGLLLALLNQAAAAAYTPASVSTWYFDGGNGTLTGENTSAPTVTGTDIAGTLYGTFGDVTLGVGDTISYTFTMQTAGTAENITALRFGLWNNSSDVGSDYAANKTTWTGFWGDNNSLQTASGGGQPFNFGPAGSGATFVGTATNDTATADPNGITIVSLTVERTSETRYTLTATTHNSGLAGDSVNTYISGYIDNYVVENNTFNTFALYLSAAQALTRITVPPRRVSLEGIGIQIRPVNDTYRYKSDHLDTDSWDYGLIFPMSAPPSQVVGKEYAGIDWRPYSGDPRTNDVIKRFKANGSGDLLIAMPSSAAAGNGWTRLTAGSTPDFYLDNATREGVFTPDTNAPYWFYRLSYPTAEIWVSLPTNSVATDHSPFVFAATNELWWDNPPDLMGNAVTIAQKWPGELNTTVANPNLMVMSNGNYLAMISGVVSTNGEASLWRSVNKGLNWTEVASGFQVNKYSFFELQGSIYLLGMDTSGAGETRIYKSRDNGATWTTSVFAGYGGQDAPSEVDIANGRVWKAAFSGVGPGFYSAPTNANLMLESSWTLSVAAYGTVTLANGQKFSPGDEVSLIKSKEGILYNLGRDQVYRPEDGWQDGITTLQPNLNDLTKTTWDPNYAGPRLPGNGNGKCTARYDPVSEKYWALTSGQLRGRLNLYSASSAGGRIGDFEFRGTILAGNSSYQGFNYPFMQFDGNDIIFSLRTAWDTHRGRASRWHDGNIFTFHRVKDFRTLGTPNYVVNSGFENAMAGWLTLSAGDEDADYTQVNNAYAGSYNLVHYKASAYKVNTYQSLIYLSNGTYTASAWVKCSGGQNQCYLYVNGYGGAEIRTNIPASSTYTRMTIPNINLTSGACNLGVYSDANAGDWVTLDNVEFFNPASVITPPSAPGFLVSGIQVSGGTVSLMATGAMGSTYTLWATTNIVFAPVTSTWTLLTNGTITASPFTITDLGAVANQQRFYRFRAP